MRILFLTYNYPHQEHSFTGIFSERAAAALRRLGHEVAVLAPRPLAPPILSSVVDRWRAYARIPTYEVRNGITIRRPRYFQLPGLGGAFWFGAAAYGPSRRAALAMHRDAEFSAVLAFGLVDAGVLAWRIGNDLGLPTCGWALGDDVPIEPNSMHGRAVVRALQKLELVFYQNSELCERATRLLRRPGETVRNRHTVLPHGIPAPPPMQADEIRLRVRRALGLSDDQVLVLSIGRISRAKGTYELAEAIALAAARTPRIKCIAVGSQPAFDETRVVLDMIGGIPDIRRYFEVVPACSPDKVWEYLCAADIFAFTSHREGMPNSLLEAMTMGLPAVAFSIPPVAEIEAGIGALVTIAPFDSRRFAAAIVHLATSPHERSRIGRIGQARVREGFNIERNLEIASRQIAELVEKQRVSSSRCRADSLAVRLPP